MGNALKMQSCEKSFNQRTNFEVKIKLMTLDDRKQA